MTQKSDRTLAGDRHNVLTERVTAINELIVKSVGTFLNKLARLRNGHIFVDTVDDRPITTLENFDNEPP